jgi:hypothetical protein
MTLTREHLALLILLWTVAALAYEHWQDQRRLRTQP